MNVSLIIYDSYQVPLLLIKDCLSVEHSQLFHNICRRFMPESRPQDKILIVKNKWAVGLIAVEKKIKFV